MEKPPYWKKTAAIIGNTGVGKTSIYNKICGTSHAAGYNSCSLTRELRSKEAVVGKNAFSLIDTPGFNSKVASL